MECSVFYEDEKASPIASEPLIVRVTLFSKLRGLLFWVVLLPFLLLRENRSLKALWIFLPYYAWLGIGVGLGGLWRMPSELLIPLPAILCGVFLAGQRILRWNGWLVLLATVLFAALVHLVWFLGGQVEYAIYSAVGSGILCLVALISLLLARVCCRGRYGALKLALFLLPIAMIITQLIVMGTAFLMFRKHAGAGFGGMTMMLMRMAIPAGVAGLIIYLQLLSFLAVPFSTEFYRQRLCGLLKLKRAAPPVLEPPPEPIVPS